MRLESKYNHKLTWKHVKPKRDPIKSNVQVKKIIIVFQNTLSLKHVQRSCVLTFYSCILVFKLLNMFS